MAKAKKKESTLTLEEKLAQALVPESEQPYKVPKNWCWVKGLNLFEPMQSKKPEGKYFIYIDIESVDNKTQCIESPKNILVSKAPSRASRELKFGDTVFSMVRPYLRNIAFIDESLSDAIASTGFYVCRPNKAVFNKYNYWMLVSDYVVEGLNRFMKGDNSPSIRRDDIEQFAYPLPPLSEQQRIVERIESLFAKLDEAKEKLQEVLDGFEKRKAVILHKAFTGELTAKWREENGVSLESWEKKKFKDFCAVVRGGSPRPAGSPIFYDGNIPFMKVADITNNSSPYIYATQYTIKEAGLKKTRMVDANTLLLTNSGATLGVPAITKIQTTFNDGIAAFIGLEVEALEYYYYFWMSKTDELRNINKGAAQPNLNTNIISEIEIDLPDINERIVIQKIIEGLLSDLEETKDKVMMALENIEIMKKAILARAFRGELGTNDENDESAVELLKRVL